MRLFNCRKVRLFRGHYVGCMMVAITYVSSDVRVYDFSRVAIVVTFGVCACDVAFSGEKKPPFIQDKANCFGG